MDPQEIIIESTPPGASVIMDGALLGRAPLTLKSPTSAGEHSFVLKLDDHEPVRESRAIKKRGRQPVHFKPRAYAAVMVITDLVGVPMTLKAGAVELAKAATSSTGTRFEVDPGDYLLRFDGTD